MSEEFAHQMAQTRCLRAMRDRRPLFLVCQIPDVRNTPEIQCARVSPADPSPALWYSGLCSQATVCLTRADNSVEAAAKEQGLYVRIQILATC
jgi:hypothetical protein